MRLNLGFSNNNIFRYSFMKTNALRKVLADILNSNKHCLKVVSRRGIVYYNTACENSLCDYIIVYTYQIVFRLAKVMMHFCLLTFYFILDSLLHHYTDNVSMQSSLSLQVGILLSYYDRIFFCLPAGIDRSRPIGSIYDISVRLDQVFCRPQDVPHQSLCVSRTHWGWYT